MVALRILPAACMVAALWSAGAADSGEQPAIPDPEPTAGQAAAVARLIRDLGAGEAGVRKAAREGLLAIGRPALEALREASRSQDFEISTSADELIEAIERSPDRPARPADPVPTAGQAADIARLIGDLGAEDPKVRAAAIHGLTAIGRPALAALRAAARSSDAEVAATAKALIAAIRRRTAVTVLREGGTKVTVTSRAETVVIDWGGGRVRVERTPEGGAAEAFEAESAEKFRERHPEAWRNYVEPAMDESKQSRLLIEATFQSMRGELVRKLTAALGRAPTDAELAENLADLRARLEEAYGAKSGGGPQPTPRPRPDPAKGPQLAPLE